MTTSKKLYFHSLFEDPFEGSMARLLELAGMTEVAVAEADIIVFNGGADIGTSIYGEQPVSRGIPRDQSLRDKREIDVFEKHRDPAILKVGICRGAQLLNCLNGGTLWQDVDKHGRDHKITILASGHTMQATSTHHQMMRPNWDKVQMIAVAAESTYKYAEKDNYPPAITAEDRLDPEILYYPETNCLCIQGHPEYVPGSIFANYCIDLINHYYQETRACAA